MEKFTFLVTQTDIYRKHITVEAEDFTKAELQLETQLGDLQMDQEKDTFVSSSQDYHLVPTKNK